MKPAWLGLSRGMFQKKISGQTKDGAFPVPRVGGGCSLVKKGDINFFTNSCQLKANFCSIDYKQKLKNPVKIFLSFEYELCFSGKRQTNGLIPVNLRGRKGLRVLNWWEGSQMGAGCQENKKINIILKRGGRK